jgi:transcriptional regulator with XRE-family HTH domain
VNNVDAKEFGLYLKSLRNNNGFTLTELGDLIGYSNPYLSQIENGKKGVPSPGFLKKLANPLNISYTQLLGKAGYLEEESEAVWEERGEEGEDFFDLFDILILDIDLYYKNRKLTGNDRKKIKTMLETILE